MFDDTKNLSLTNSIHKNIKILREEKKNITRSLSS